jgi:enoyl-CoA hydratase/carnithine racemase
MTYQFLPCEQKEDVATVILNRPEKRNAWSSALRDEDRALLGYARPTSSY